MAIVDLAILRKGDVFLTISIAVLVAFGFSAIFSIELSQGSANVFLEKQAIALGIGLVASVALATMNYHMMRLESFLLCSCSCLVGR
jgi:cell division protein FtsW (lipid II flippase)